MGRPGDKVTELDFRKDEFRDAQPEDYEFRTDGELVRKDRWERAVKNICEMVGLSRSDFEISAVVDKVRELTARERDWVPLEYKDSEYPTPGAEVDVKLVGDDELHRVTYEHGRSSDEVWTWIVTGQPLVGTVVAWRSRPAK